MKKIKIYLKTIRYNLWIKNFLVFAPLFFGIQIFDISKLINTILVFIIFSCSASVVYILNDLYDQDMDRLHPTKKNRPIAAGLISKKEIIFLIVLLEIIASILLIIIGNYLVGLIILAYIVINLFYTYYYKHLPIWDLVMIAIMNLLRIYAGSIAISIITSEWLFITVFFGSLIFVIGKRYTELKNGKLRKVLGFYTSDFLRSLLTTSVTITVTSFTIYCIEKGTNYLPLSIILTFILYRTFLILETSDLGEHPESVFTKDKQILFMLLLFILYAGYLIYVL